MITANIKYSLSEMSTFQHQFLTRKAYFRLFF